LADAAKSGAKKKSGQANKHKNATKDRNPGFVRLDYENICSYLEDQVHYNGLFGDSKQTTWGKKNIPEHRRSNGSGLMELTNTTLQEEVDDQCPCFEQMCAIFGDKQNIAGFNSFDSSLQINKDHSNSNSSNCDSFSDSGNSSCEEGRSVNASITINPGENELHLEISDSNRLTSASGGTNNPSSPRFKEIHTSGSSITSTPIQRVRTKGKNH
ncbi:hypothetical protein O181_133968, partial [Austropuccinia psidii MF-1]|nr:hypothetical protein [Austropuccinia psidii MF-1]